jgi:hypothetical protein
LIIEYPKEQRVKRRLDWWLIHGRPMGMKGRMQHRVPFRGVDYAIPEKWCEMICVYKISHVFAGVQKFEYVGDMASFLRLRKTEIYASDHKFADQWHT